MYEKLKQENEQLETLCDNQTDIIMDLTQKIKELEHRLANCIEPKFKVGQEVWVSHKNLDDIVETEIESICIEIEDGVIDVTYYNIDGIGFGDYDLFATEEEAKAKLEEIKNGQKKFIY